MGGVEHRRQEPAGESDRALRDLDNGIIVRAGDEREALRKAKRKGQSEAGDAGGSLRLGSEPAICQFLGVSSLGLVHEPLRDGAEICWKRKRCKQSVASRLPTVEATLLRLARKELGYVQHRNGARAHAEPVARANAPGR